MAGNKRRRAKKAIHTGGEDQVNTAPSPSASQSTSLSTSKKRKITGGLHTGGDDQVNAAPLPSASQPTFLSTFNRDSNYPIFKKFCDILPISEIIALTRTCKALSDLYRYLLPMQWDVNKDLRRFVDDPYRFRSQMGKCDAVISGSFALQYFERVTWMESDLDIFILQGDGAIEFKEYLIKVEGYELVQNQETIDYGMPSLLEIWTFTRGTRSEVESEQPKTKVQIVTMGMVPVRGILQGFYSTVVINIITWNKAYSLFPLLTFAQRNGYMLKGIDEFYAGLVAKYGRRGWKIEEIMWPQDKRPNHPIRRYRRLGDSFTWVIPFDNRKIECPKTPDHVLELASFQIGGTDQTYPDLSCSRPLDAENLRSKFYSISCLEFVAKVLKHTYLWVEDTQCDFIGLIVDRLTVLELRKMDPAAQPANYAQVLKSPIRLHEKLRDFEPPATWTYYDDDFPKWYKAWEEAKAERRVY